jgi:hypothetical protein
MFGNEDALLLLLLEDLCTTNKAGGRLVVLAKRSLSRHVPAIAALPYSVINVGQITLYSSNNSAPNSTVILVLNVELQHGNRAKFIFNVLSDTY